MIYRFFRKKRAYALLFIVLILVLFYNSAWMGRWMYPIKYEEEIRSAAHEQQVDPLLLAAIVRVESNYKVDKISKKGAVGLMQLMPDTANWIADLAGYQIPIEHRLMEPVVNIDIGARYVRSLNQQFGSAEKSETDRIALVAAAYNAGPGSVGKWLENGDWAGDYADVSRIPYGETRHFVQRIVYYYNIYNRYYEI